MTVAEPDALAAPRGRPSLIEFYAFIADIGWLLGAGFLAYFTLVQLGLTGSSAVLAGAVISAGIALGAAFLGTLVLLWRTGTRRRIAYLLSVVAGVVAAGLATFSIPTEHVPFVGFAAFIAAGMFTVLSLPPPREPASA